MDKYRKCAESLIKLGDEIIAERRRRRKAILCPCAIGAGAAVVLVVGILTFALRPPTKPTTDSSKNVFETNDKNAAANNGVSTNSLLTAPSTSVAYTTVAEKRTGTTTTAVTATAVSDETSLTQTTTQAATATSPAATMPSDMTYMDIVAANVRELTLFEGKHYQLWRYYSESDQSTITITDEDIGEFLTEISVEPTEYTELLPETLNADVYQIGTISGDYAVAVRFEGTELNLIYHNLGYKPDSLEQFAEDLDVQNSLKVEYVKDNEHTYTRPANKDDVFAILFAENCSYSYSLENGQRVWLGASVIPIPDDSLHFEVNTNFLIITPPAASQLIYFIGKDKAKEFVGFVEDQY